MLQSSINRLVELFKWGHINEEQYLKDYEDIQQKLNELTPDDDRSKILEKLVDFLSNVAAAWQQATQEQRNRLGRALFEQIRVEGKRVVFVKPRDELKSLFKLNFECHAKDIAGDPEGI